MKYQYIYLFLLYNIITIFPFSTNINKYIKISFTDKDSVPIIRAQLKNKVFLSILDNNLGFNYVSTKNFNLTDIKFNFNNDKINIKDKTYDAYFYIGDIAIFDDNNYIHLDHFNSFIIDDKYIISSITISYLLQGLKEESFINKKNFYLDINNKKLYLGELPLESEEYSKIYYNDKLIHSSFISNKTKGVFKQKLSNLYLDDNSILLNEFASFSINEYYTMVPFSLLNDIIENKNIQKLDCILHLIDVRGIYAIKCPKNNIYKMPNLYFVFDNNYTFNIPFDLLFEDYDDNYKISLFRNKLKYNMNENNNNENKNQEELIIGYSIIKLFNYTIFSYDERKVTFYSDKFISNNPPKFLNKIIIFLLYFLFGLLLIATPYLIYLKLKMKNIISNYKYTNIFS